SDVAGDTHFVQVSAAGTTSCAVTSEGVAYCWGDNAGDNTSSPRSKPTPVDVTNLPSGTKSVTSVYATDRGGCVYTSEGQVYCWASDNYNGWVGDNTQTAKY